MSNTVSYLCASACFLFLSLSAAGEESLGSLLDQAQDRTKEKQFTQALTLYEEVIKRDPENFEALYKSGWIENEREQFASALIFLEKARRLKNDESYVYVDMGFAYARLRRADEAIAAFQKATQINSWQFKAWHGLADVYFDLKHDYQSATQYYQKAYYFRADDPVVNYRLGLCYEENKNYEQAEPYLRRVADRVLGFVPAQTELGYCYWNLRDYDSAKNRYERALKMDPGNKQAHYYLGRTLIMLGQSGRALNEVEALKSISPDLSRKLSAEISARKE